MNNVKDTYWLTVNGTEEDKEELSKSKLNNIEEEENGNSGVLGNSNLNDLVAQTDIENLDKKEKKPLMNFISDRNKKEKKFINTNPKNNIQHSFLTQKKTHNILKDDIITMQNTRRNKRRAKRRNKRRTKRRNKRRTQRGNKRTAKRRSTRTTKRRSI